MSYVVQIRSTICRDPDWSDWGPPFDTLDDAQEFITWNRKIDAKPPVGRYGYRIEQRDADAKARGE
jgi:hypothetical protein